MDATAMVDRVDLGDHVCWAFDDQAGELAAVGRYVAAGLRRGQKVVYFTEALAPGAVRAHLQRVVRPAVAALERGQLRIDRAVETYLTDGRFDPARVIDRLREQVATAEREGWSGLRLVGDMAWAVPGVAGVEHLPRYEAEVNRLFIDGWAAAMCLYDRRVFPAARLHPLAAAHPATAGPYGGSTWNPMLRARWTADPPGLCLAGQVDRSNRDAFAALLAGLGARSASGRPPVLDLSEISFLDVAAAGTLLRAGVATATGLQVVGCRPSVARLLELVRQSGVREAVGRPA